MQFIFMIDFKENHITIERMIFKIKELEKEECLLSEKHFLLHKTQALYV